MTTTSNTPNKSYHLITFTVTDEYSHTDRFNPFNRVIDISPARWLIKMRIDKPTKNFMLFYSMEITATEYLKLRNYNATF